MTQEDHVNRQKICRVCSDKAMGFNFNAITCESCKAFFRRNAFKGEKLRCPFNNDCIIDKSTRRFCQKCRLEKCIQVGMKKEWILSEEQKKIKRAKIAENRMKRKVDDSTGDPKDELDDEPPTSSNNKNKRVYSKDGGPTTPSSSISISCSSSRCSSQFGEDNGTGSQFTYRLFPENPNVSSSPNDPSRKDSLVSCDADTESETMKLLTKVELKTMASDSQKRDTKNDTTIDSHLVKNTTMAERCNARTSDTACLLLDKDLHESWVSLITDPSSSLNVITRKSCPSANHDWNSHNSETLGYNDNVENMEYSSTETHRQTSSTLLLSLTTPVATTRPQLEPLHNNARSYDAREEFWRLKVNHRILEANFAPIYLRNNDKEISNVLNDLETAKINELVQAFSAIDEPILDNSCSQNPGISDVIRFSDLAIRRLIKWCKKINAFASLCLEDQMALLKAGCLEMLSMKASFNFNLDDESWQDTYTKYGLKLTIFRKASEKLYEAHRQFIRTFNQRWRTDHKVNLLLVAIVLFNPDRPNLLHPATVRLEHYTYIYLLRRYLESKSDSQCQARTDHYHLMLKIEDLRELHEKTLELYSEAGPEVVGPLLIEILDLK